MPMLPLVCNDAVAVLFMFDLSRRSTLESVKDWYRQVRAVNKVVPTFSLEQNNARTNELRVVCPRNYLLCAADMLFSCQLFFAQWCYCVRHSRGFVIDIDSRAKPCISCPKKKRTCSSLFVFSLLAVSPSRVVLFST
jgi:hypothetical protein